MKLAFESPDYPDALRQLPNPPRAITTSGPLEPRRAIAIVGSREACDEARVFAHDLAFQLASAGILVISGGALGVDGAAHRGAMAAGGATWVVSPTGKDRLYPPEHARLFDEIAASSEHRMIWPFDDDAPLTQHNFRYRNGILTALCEALVMVQAHFKSGSRNAANWARSLGRPVWAVPGAPWMGGFCGSLADIETGLARPLCSTNTFFEELGLPPPLPAPEVDRSGEIVREPKAPPKPVDTTGWEPDVTLLFSKLSMEFIHPDEMASRTGLPAEAVTTALLTLTMEDVVVEGPTGFFRRRNAT